MTSTFNAVMPSITIPDGTDVSNIITEAQMEDALTINLYAPASLDTPTYTIEVAKSGTTNWRTLVDDQGSNIGPPAAGKARAFFDVPRLGNFRIKASSNVSGDQTWECDKSWS